jgi:two-component system sensor histidine kinase EvgS
MDALEPNRSALLVDDAAVVGLFVTRTLEAIGHRVARVSTVTAAVAALAEAHFDVVLVDAQLETATTEDTVRSIRSCRRSIPIVALAASWSDPAELADEGFDGVLGVPFDEAGFERAIAHRSTTDDVFDSADLRRRAGSDDLAREVVGDILRDAPVWLDALRSSVDAGAHAEAGATAHRFKGALAAIGAKAASRAAARLEAAAREPGSSALGALLATFERRLIEASRVLTTFAARAPSEKTSSHRGSTHVAE